MDVLLRLDKRCNQDCYFCNILAERGLSSDQAIVWIRSVKNIKVLSITGGEPTLVKDLCAVIQEAKDSREIESINLQTNAARVSAAYALQLKKAGLDTAFVSFHSHRERLSNILTRSQLWGKTVSGIRNFIAADVDVVLNTVICKATYKDLPRFCEFVKETFPEVKQICFSCVQPHGKAWTFREVLIPRYSDVFPFLKEAVQLCDAYGIQYFNPYCGFPLCLFPGKKERSSEFSDKDVVSSFEKKGVVSVCKEKIHGPACQKCLYNNQCNGVWKKYADIYGFSELKPFRSEQGDA